MARGNLQRQRKHAQGVLSDTECERLLGTEINLSHGMYTVEQAMAALDWITERTDESAPTFILHLAARLDQHLAKEFGLALAKHYFAAATDTAGAALQAAARGHVEQIDRGPFSLVVTCHVVPLAKGDHNRHVKVVAVSSQWKATGEASGNYTAAQAERIMATLKAAGAVTAEVVGREGLGMTALLPADQATAPLAAMAEVRP